MKKSVAFVPPNYYNELAIFCRSTTTMGQNITHISKHETLHLVKRFREMECLKTTNGNTNNRDMKHWAQW